MPDTLQPVPANGVDPNVVLPPHVKAAMAASTAAHTAAYAAPAAEQGTAPPQPATATPGVAAQPAAPAAAPAATATPPAELPENNADGSPNWENRFKALMGRYQSDRQRTAETLQEMETRLREATRQPRQPLPGEGEGPPPTLVSQKEIEDYGPDLIDVIKRAATEAVMPLLKPLATNLGQVAQRIETTESEASKQFLVRMNGAMDARVPGWQELNRDEKFIAWTRRSDVYSGLNRQELLQKAWYAGDSNRVAAFFEGFLAEEAAVDPAAAQARQQAWMSAGGHAAGPASSAQPSAPRVTLAQLAAPGRARAATEVPAGTKPVWTAEGISQFYMDCARGVFNGREQERLATEADLMAAQREGRIMVNPRTATRIG